MYIVETQYFNLKQICDSGQCFRMNRIPLVECSWYYDSISQPPFSEHGCRDAFEKDSHVVAYRLIAGHHYIEAVQMFDLEKRAMPFENADQPSRLFFDCEEEEYENFWKDYFDLSTDYESYLASINPNDHYLMQCAASASGVRILRQDLWEMIVTFLISQQNNIKRIRRCIDNICQKYGESMERNGRTYHAFPTPEALAYLPEDALMECNLGYRSKYVVRTARSIVEGHIDLELIRRLTYKEAKQALLDCYGIGTKVADCICLFSLHHLDAFPIDTHIRQVLDAHYKRGFPNRRYKGYRGVVQQYIFYGYLSIYG